MLFPALITILALMMYQFFGAKVSHARGKFGVKAPAITGNPDFERVERVHANTLEALIVFIPALWIFGLFWPAPQIAAGIGFVWIIGRVIYAISYYKAAEKRTAGYIISALASAVLVLGSLAAIFKKLWEIYHGSVSFLS